MTAPRSALILRGAGAADLPEIHRIVEAGFGHYVARLGRKPGPMLADYPGFVADGVVTLAECDGEVAGLLVLLDHADHLMLDTVVVDPQRQGEGIGRALMDHAESEARRRGHHEIRLYTNERMTENIAMYRRAGYTETGRAEQQGLARVFFAKALP